MAQPSTERRTGPRARLRVVHRHRIGTHRLSRVSELVYVRGQPKVVLEWVDLAGVRAPLYLALDPERLHAPRRSPHLYTYDGETTDPRFDPFD
jgi:hypothetical protein